MKIDVANTKLSKRGVSKLVGTLGFLLAALILFAGLALLTMADAPPEQPHQFWGYVSGAPSGSEVSARIDGVEYATTTVDADGYYGVDPLFKVPADDPRTPEKEGGEDGDWVRFYVGDVQAGKARFESGATTQVNLVVDVVPPEIGVALSKELVEPANGTAFVSGIVEFQVVLTNTGETDWVSGSFTDTFDACLSLQEVSVGGVTVPVEPEDGVVSGDLVPPTPIEPGEVVVIDMTFLAEEAAEECCNAVEVVMQDADEQEASASDEACVEIVEGEKLYLPFVVNGATTR